MKRLMASVTAIMIIHAVSFAAGQAAAGTRETVLAVQGMVCSSCTAAVEKSLKNLEGVAAAHADIKADQVTVRYDAGKVTPQQMVEALRKAGYRARWSGEQASPGQEKILPQAAPR
jgi:copper chaperone CopZ